MLVFEWLGERDVGVLGKLKDNISLLFEIYWVLERVAFSFLHYQPNIP